MPLHWQEVEHYARTNRSAFNPPRKSGLVITSAEHVGEVPPPEVDDPNAVLHLITDEVIEMAWAGKADIPTIVDPIIERMWRLKYFYPKAPGGTPPPPPPGPTVLNEYGTYQGHGLAVDLYPLGRGQNSKGFTRTLPIDVVLSAYQFQGPLATYEELLAVCPASPVSLSLAGVLGTSLHTRVAQPAKRLLGGITGREIKAFWSTHVDAVSPHGGVAAHTPAWIVSDSGIEFERIGIKAEAAHEHWAISYSGQLSPNGEGDPADLFAAFGWTVKNVGQVPGPQEYLGRQGWRGLLQAPPA